MEAECADRLVRPRGLSATVAACLIASSMWACAEPSSGVGALEVTRTDSAGIEIVSIAGPVESLPVWHLSAEPLAVVSGEEEPFLSWIGEIEILADGRFLVEDNMSAGLYLFEGDARDFKTVGIEGDGPGEYRNLTELSLGRGDTAYAYDRRLYRVTVLDPEGAFVSSVQLTRDLGGPRTLSLDAWGFASDRIVLQSSVPVDTTETRLPRRDRSWADLYSLDETGEVRAGPVRFEGDYSVRDVRFDAGAYFGQRPIVASGAGVLVYGPAVAYDLTVATPEMEPIRVVRWNGWRVPLTDSLLTTVRDSIEAGMAEFRERDPETADAMLRAQFADHILPDTLPALASALVDDIGRLWVSRYRPVFGEWNEEDAWHVLAPDGTPLGRLVLEPSTRLAAVRGDRVAVITRDELDVQHVHVHRLIEPGPD